MGKRKLGALEKLEVDLCVERSALERADIARPALQNKIRRDPLSYKSDFERQYEQYQTLYQIFKQSGSTNASNLISLRDQIDLISHVCDNYPELTRQFQDDLIDLLTQQHFNSDPELREKVISSLVLLRNRGVIDSVKLLNAFFPLLISTPSKSLRAFLFQKILADIRSANAKTTNHKLNRTLQHTLFNLVTADPTSPKGLWAVKITRELWKRQVWKEAKAVEIMKEAALAENDKVVIGGVRFFLTGDEERQAAEEESSDDDGTDLNALRHQMGINKKSKKRMIDLKKSVASIKKKEKKKGQPQNLNFSALHLLNNPQNFVESLFSKHLQNPRSKLNLEQKLLVLQLVTRLVGLHQLMLENLYSYFLKYLTPRQASVTTFLACAAQSSHSLVPPDLVSPLVSKIANEFVSEAAASEVASAGLNAIREICARQPLAMDATLLQDLVQYRKSKDKGVMMASKGLLSLYRKVGAELLHRRDRGKEATLNLRSGNTTVPRFGEAAVDDGIEGIELLEEWKEEERRRRQENGESLDSETEARLNDEQGWANWDVDDSSDESGSWIAVASDDGHIELSDSESDERDSKRVKVDSVQSPAAASVNTAMSSSNLATTTILTPADFAKLQELRMKSAVESATKSHKTHHQTSPGTLGLRHMDDGITAEEIEGLALLSHKATKEEKLAKAKGDKDDKHLSTTAMRKDRKRAAGKSTSNKEKERQKNFLMTLGKAKRKGRRPLTEVRRVMKGHVERSKRGGRRGNKG